MSNDTWIVQTLKKYRLTVDFCLNHVECDWGEKYPFGEGAEFETFEEALSYVAYTVRKRRGDDECK